MAEETPKDDEGKDAEKGKKVRDETGKFGFSQDQVNAIVAEEKRRYQERLSEIEKEAAKNQKQLETILEDHKQLQSKVAVAEGGALKYKIALEQGLPKELADRLQGDDEESLKQDAEALSKLVKDKKPLETGPKPDPPDDSNDDFATRIRKQVGIGA